jgi:PAS domain S-box-containing protein
MTDRLDKISDLTDKLNQSEAQLKQSLSMYKALSDATFEAVLIIIDDVCVETNKATQEIFGYSRDDLVGTNPLKHVHPEYKKVVEKNVFSHTISPYEAIVIRKDGTQVDVELQSKKVEFFDKTIITVVVRDITQQKKSRESILRLLELWESTFNSINDMISIHNLDFEIIEINDAYRRKFGQRCLGKKCFEIVHNNCHSEDCPFLKYFNNLKIGDSIERKSHTIEVQAAPEEWYEVTCSPIISNGSVTGIVHLMKDISQRKMYDEKIIRSNELYKNLIDATSVAILVYEDSIITDINSSFMRLIGVKSKDEVLFKNLVDVGFNKDSISVLCKKIQENDRRKFQIALTTKNNVSKIVDIRARMFKYGGKQGVIAVTIDPVATNEKRRGNDNV